MPADWSLADIWERNKFILRGIANTILIDHSVVEDVLQDAFSQVLSAGPELQDEQQAYNYARRTVINTAINHYRHCRRNFTLIQNLKEQLDEADERTPLVVMMEGERNQLEAALMREIEPALSQLNLDRRQALDLVLHRPGKLKDICREKGIPYTTLRSRFLKAIDQIRKHLRAKNLLPDDEGVPK